MSFFETGVYTIPEAARLIGVPNRKLRGWVAGYPKTRGSPVVPSEIRSVGNKLAMSFINLIEARFVKIFSAQGVNLNSLRVMADEAKRMLNHPRPFATDIIFKTDSQTVFIEVAERTGDKKTLRPTQKELGVA